MKKYQYIGRLFVLPFSRQYDLWIDGQSVAHGEILAPHLTQEMLSALAGQTCEVDLDNYAGTQFRARLLHARRVER